MRRVVIESSQRSTLRLVGTGEAESGSALSPFGPVRAGLITMQRTRQGSSAYGIAQLLRETDHRSEYQILRGLKYIKVRHQSPCRAWNFFLKRNYY
jgi:hypothetical protein